LLVKLSSTSNLADKKFEPAEFVYLYIWSNRIEGALFLSSFLNFCINEAVMTVIIIIIRMQPVIIAPYFYQLRSSQNVELNSSSFLKYKETVVHAGT